MKPTAILGTVKHALHAVNELGVSESIRVRGKWDSVCVSENISPGKLRHLCPTRWNVRLKAVNRVLERYAQVLQTLEELKQQATGHVAVRCEGLLEKFQRSETYVALGLARSVLEQLDKATVIAQKTDCTVSELTDSFLVDPAFKWWEAWAHLGPVLRRGLRALDNGGGQAKRGPWCPLSGVPGGGPPTVAASAAPRSPRPTSTSSPSHAQDSVCPLAGPGAGATTPAPAR